MIRSKDLGEDYLSYRVKRFQNVEFSVATRSMVHDEEDRIWKDQYENPIRSRIHTFISW